MCSSWSSAIILSSTGPLTFTFFAFTFTGCYLFLYADKRFSFDKLLFYGNELCLVIFEVLFFGTMDLAVQNYVFDGAMLYLLMEVCGLVDNQLH